MEGHHAEVMRRGRPDECRSLSASEDHALRRAFGRFAEAEARRDGACVLREHQAARGGQWFACDCRTQGGLFPVLVPVAEAYVRRHVEAPWPEHATWCDFFHEVDEQRIVSASYRRPSFGSHLRLVRGFASEEPLERTINIGGRERGRSRLANLLLTLLEGAKLTRAQPGQLQRTADQFGAIRKAAEGIDLDAEVPLSRFLCTYPPALPEFLEKIGRTPPDRFKHSRRPHGLLIGVATEAAEGRIVPLHGAPLDVAGGITICGEEDGHAEGRRAGARERAPYLMACIVGRRHPDEEVTVLRAYLHPCATPTWLLPVESNYERGTLKQLLSVGRRLAEKRGVELTIEKPVFDLTPPTGLGREVKEPSAHEPIIPDFIVRATSGRSVVLETMGYEQSAYRDRKARIHLAMSKACQDAQVIEHDFCFPAEWSQEQRDTQFWRACQRALAGRPRAEGRRPSDEETRALRRVGPRTIRRQLEHHGLWSRALARSREGT